MAKDLPRRDDGCDAALLSQPQTEAAYASHQSAAEASVVPLRRRYSLESVVLRQLHSAAHFANAASVESAWLQPHRMTNHLWSAGNQEYTPPTATSTLCIPLFPTNQIPHPLYLTP